jgi:hypothetical protein
MTLIIIPKPEEYRRQNYETASWWTQHTLQPGAYEVQKRGHDGYMQHIVIDSVMTESYFVNRLFTASSVDHKTGLSRKEGVVIGWYAWEMERVCAAHGWTAWNEGDPCPLCGDDCERRGLDCCDCQRWDCEVAQDDEVRVCAVLPGGSSPCEHHDFYESLRRS